MSLIVAIIVGAIAGWLAGQIVKGEGMGTLVNIVVGIVGALIASWIFPALGMGSGEGTNIIGDILYATIGAVILLVLLRLVRRAS